MANNCDRRGGYLARGRAETLAAGRLLVLLKFQNHPAAPTLSPAISTYSDMLAPSSTDERRLAACNGYITGVQEALIIERHHFAAAERRDRSLDPYGEELKTTIRGALLDVAAGHLARAVQCYLLAQVPLISRRRNMQSSIEKSN